MSEPEIEDAAESHNPRRPKLIGFYSFKGGAGCTLAAAHMGYFFARIGKRVLLVDANLLSPGLSLWEESRASGTPGLAQLLTTLQTEDMDELGPNFLGEHVHALPRDFFAGERDREPPRTLAQPKPLLWQHDCR